MSPDVKVVDWSGFAADWPHLWAQGQHVTMIGPTGVGKTTLAIELVKPRGYVIAFGTKPKDDTLEPLIRDGWVRVDKWPPPQGKDRVILWPKIKDPNQILTVQRQRFADAMNGIYKQGMWCVWIDELLYMTQQLKLRAKLQMYYTHARSLKISLLGATQRPAWVPPEAFNQAGHLIIWRTGDERDLVKIGSMNGLSARTVAGIVGELDYREFLHVDLVRQSLTVSEFKPTKGKG